MSIRVFLKFQQIADTNEFYLLGKLHNGDKTIFLKGKGKI